MESHPKPPITPSEGKRGRDRKKEEKVPWGGDVFKLGAEFS